MNYEGWGMTPAQDFLYPIEYHNRYGYMYPSLAPGIDNGMVQHIMYPDIYYRIYPQVHRTCDRMDNPYMYYPSEAHVESMINECYDTCVREMPDLIHYADMKAEQENIAEANQFRRRPLLRDLIAIILIRELFRRRRIFDNGGVYGPGAGYGPNYGPNYGYSPGYELGNGYGLYYGY